MSEQTSPLTDFLLARIAEDAAAARLRKVGGHFLPDLRVLAECEAKRRIVALHTPEDIGYGDCPKCDGGYGEHEFYPCQTLRALAAIYADHDDFQEDWRV